jgi:hypothetical protein
MRILDARIATAPLAVALLIATLFTIAGCEEINPAQPRTGAYSYPLPDEPDKGDQPPRFTRATRVDLYLQIDEHNETDDHVMLSNRSDGAVYGLEITVNNDYRYTLGWIERGQHLRIPESYFVTDAGRKFPSEQRVRMERVEIRHRGKLVAFQDLRGYPPPGR